MLLKVTPAPSPGQLRWPGDGVADRVRHRDAGSQPRQRVGYRLRHRSRRQLLALRYTALAPCRGKRRAGRARCFGADIPGHSVPVVAGLGDVHTQQWPRCYSFSAAVVRFPVGRKKGDNAKRSACAATTPVRIQRHCLAGAAQTLKAHR
jgi:hypothetical protein